MARIQIIVGTVMGTAEGVAKYLAKQLCDEHQVEVNLAPSINDLTRDSNEILLFCTSNTGAGELPENIRPLYDAIETNTPDLSYRIYGLINLGDSSYPTFGKAGSLLDISLSETGALRHKEVLVIDAMTDRYPQKIAYEWAKNWLASM